MNRDKVKIFPWNPKSNGARELSSELGVKRLKNEGSIFKGTRDHTIINWGSSEIPFSVQGSARIVNRPEKVSRVSNKLLFFQDQSSKGSARIPEFTPSREKAISWVREGKRVLARTKLRASGGKGIVFIEDDLSNWINAELYVVYKPKKSEFRIHIILGDVVTVQKKVLRKVDDVGNNIDPKTIDFRIRNVANGFIFQRQNIEVPNDIVEQAQKAIEASGLDFGAVDVIWNEKEGSAYVLEINCAPGLEGTTIQEYAEAFRNNL